MNLIEKLALGSAQFGFDYGVSNLSGQTPAEEVQLIVDRAHDAGIRLIDTAASYGNCESVLGRTCPEDMAIVTKLPASETGGSDEMLGEVFERSLVQLNRPSVYGLLVHAADDLISSRQRGEQIVDQLNQLKMQGKVAKCGVSVYDARQIEAILDLFVPDIIQVPLNLLDQRLLRTGHLDHLHSIGVEIHVRSVFLQGLLLMHLSQLDEYFEPYVAHIGTLHAEVSDAGLSMLQAAMMFPLQLQQISKVIVGVNSCQQLEEIIDVVDDTGAVGLEFERFCVDEPALLNPSLWKLSR